MEANGPETKEVTWGDGDDDMCRTECGLGQRSMSETGDRRTEIGGRNDKVVTVSPHYG
jgi:hypothetical protein